MKIESLMVPNPITVTVRASVEDALELMKRHAIRHLPVISANHQLRGLLTMADLKRALLPSMLGDLTLADMMIANPITVSPTDDVEYAALLIYKHKIGGLPVTQGKKLVGIITETDILRAFIDMMGLLSSSVRIDVETGTTADGLNKAIGIIQNQGAEIINIGMATPKTTDLTYYFRLSPCDLDPIKKELEKQGFSISDVMI